MRFAGFYHFMRTAEVFNLENIIVHRNSVYLRGLAETSHVSIEFIKVIIILAPILFPRIPMHTYGA